jgi:hypothetical protein
MQKKDDAQKVYVCCQCDGHFNSLTQFYKTYSGLYAGTGYLPICKDCFAKLFNSYVNRYGEIKKAMKRMCMAFDLYYDDAIFNKYSEDPERLIGNYIRSLNMIQYKNKTFDTSLDNGFKFNDDKEEKQVVFKPKKNILEDPKPVSQRDIDRWGIGFKNTDYGVLNSHYKFLKTANPNCDSNQEIFITDLCYTKMQQMKAVREGRVDDYNKLTESYRKSFQQAGLKTVQDDTKNPDDCWSLWTGIISQYTPEEYYKDKSLYEDWDKLGEYYERMAIRPLKNLQLGTSERDKEYYVHDDGGG